VHFLRQEELGEHHRNPYEGPAEERYREFEERFEARHGPIVAAYWCKTEASGVVLTIKHRPWVLPDVVRLHWATNWSTQDKPKLMKLLYGSRVCPCACRRCCATRASGLRCSRSSR